MARQPAAAAATLKISRVLHAGYLFESGSTAIAFDLIFENPFSRNCYAFPAVSFDIEKIRRLTFQAVFISHLHDDHFSLESLDLLQRSTPVFVYSSHPSLITLIGKLGFTDVTRLRLDEAVSIGGFVITPRLALDPDVDAVYEIEAEGLRILNVVDAWVDPITIERLSEKAPWDVLLWPFQPMRELEVLSPSRASPANFGIPVEWIEQIKALKPRFVVPSSCQFKHEDWSWYNQALFPVSYSDFEKQVTNEVRGARVQRMDPSASFELTKESLVELEPLAWVTKQTDVNVDYEYVPEAKVPSTAEIAISLSLASKNFADLESGGVENSRNAVELRRVLEYCRLELANAYRSAGSPNDPYFSESRLWRLSVFDHQGHQTDVLHEITGCRMVSVTTSQLPLGWLTEIPVTKLYAALETGESLTSLYLRVNDWRFEHDIECAVRSADVLEDPLVRSLFTGEVGAYQRAQLRRLRG